MPTPILGLRYPALSDSPDVPLHMTNLANDVESTRVTSPAPDAGFPAAATGATTEVVVNRFTVTAATFARTINVAAHTYMTGTVAGDQGNMIIYAGATQIGYARITLATVSVPYNMSATARYALPANTAVTIEVRVSRQSGTGTVNTSISAGLSGATLTIIGG